MGEEIHIGKVMRCTMADKRMWTAGSRPVHTVRSDGYVVAKDIYKK
ncbi:hypothetical protein [Nonomuraea sp. NPDC049480]